MLEIASQECTIKLIQDQAPNTFDGMPWPGLYTVTLNGSPIAYFVAWTEDEAIQKFQSGEYRIRRK